MTDSVSNQRKAGKPAVSRRTFAHAAIGVAAVAGSAGLTAWSAERHKEHGEREEPEVTRRVVAHRISGTLSRDPIAQAWRDTPAVDLPLMQQYMVAPRLQPEGMVPALSLRAMHNGSEVGFHVSWADSKSDDLEFVGHFRDSVAVQLPVDPSGPVVVVMGQPGRPVHILHWRASWQREVKDGPRAVRQAFPNAVNDLSPDDFMPPEKARAYYPALVAGNPMATRERKSPVEELVAEGYGTITSQAEQRAEGGGTHTSGRWEVVMIMPMAGGQNQPKLRASSSTSVAVAVWDGTKNDRGARKQFASWVELELEG